MMEERFDCPLLEYDDDADAVINPNRENGTVFPESAVMIFYSDSLYPFAEENALPVLDEFVSATRVYPVFRCDRDGKSIAICQAPVGAAASVQVLDWLYSRGVKRVIATGSCGVLEPLPENAFFLPVRALRDEGTSYHYMPPSRYTETDTASVNRIRSCFAARRIPLEEGATWSTDGFFRETRGKLEKRRKEGCRTVDMECSALAACAAFRKKEFGMFFFTADSLADPDVYDERGWGIAAADQALRIAVDIALDN